MIHSIGHSTLERDKFVHALRGVPIVIDIRSHPSSKWPQFRKEELEVWLPEAGLGYEWEPRLGGWTSKHLCLADEMAKHGVDVKCYAHGKFPKQRIALGIEPGDKPAWTNQGLYDFSWFMTLPEFLDAADELIERGKVEDFAMMCCEGPWYKCHRSMVSDYMVFRGSDVRHLPGKKTHAQSIGNRIERYDPEIISIWQNR